MNSRIKRRNNYWRKLNMKKYAGKDKPYFPTITVPKEILEQDD